MINPMRNLMLAVALTFSCGAVLAGGDEYDAANDIANEGPVYFGFVWDARGLPVPDARVLLRSKTGKPVELKTNLLGLYRSHISKEVSPDDVDVSCEKTGYKQARILKRAPSGSTAMNIEIDCTLQKL